jgi:hypothetical protein
LAHKSILKIVIDNNKSLYATPKTVTSATKMTQSSVIAYFFLYSMAMFSFPFLAYFGTHYALRDILNVDGFANIVWSVIASVLAVNVIIAMYAYRAYHEEEQDQPPPVPPRMKRSDLNLKQE